MPAQAWVTMIVGGLAAAGVIITWQQKNRADRRAEWWRRTQWACERTFSEDAVEVRLGWALLQALIVSRLVTRDDSEFVQVIAEHSVNGPSKAGDGR